jgi:vitamin B12 transporter
MLRRPVHKGSLNIAYVFLKDKATLNAGASIVGKRRDYSIYPYYSYLSTYYTLDMAASFQAADWLQVFGRMENIMDAKYEDVRGYRMPGRFFSVGIKATL